MMCTTIICIKGISQFSKGVAGDQIILTFSSRVVQSVDGANPGKGKSAQGQASQESAKIP
jgi:hypothetical protein